MLTWEQFMAPVMRSVSDGVTRHRREINALAADDAGLSEQERTETLNAGDLRYENRVGWALSYLARIGALDRPSRGNYQITAAGRHLLARLPTTMTEKEITPLTMDDSTGLHPYVASRRSTASPAATDSEIALDPTEQVQDGIARIHDQVAADLLDRLHAQDPAFFEQAVLDLLIAMGYGGAEGHATRTQLTGDEGIDGVIDQDALGLGRIYVQAKRYAPDNAVGRPEVQGFVGALHGRQSNQGVFITTSRFSRGALAYAESVASRVILIDGERMARLMIRYGVGVQAKDVLTIVEIDEDFFE